MAGDCVGESERWGIEGGLGSGKDHVVGIRTGVMGCYQRDFCVPEGRVDNWSLRGAEEE